MSSGLPRCSVVIPAYNAELYIDKAIKSVKAEGEGIEIIVVDDGSTDGTAGITEKIGGVNLIRQKNMGDRRLEILGF